MGPADQMTTDLRTPGVRRGSSFMVDVDGREIIAHEGESVLAVLWAAGIHRLHLTARIRQPRGFFCGIGVCFECLVSIDGNNNVRACLEPVRQGMRIRTQQDAGQYDQAGTKDHASD